jgi:hypothetical protein
VQLFERVFAESRRQAQLQLFGAQFAILSCGVVEDVALFQIFFLGPAHEEPREGFLDTPYDGVLISLPHHLILGTIYKQIKLGN